MRTIYKTKLNLTATQTVELPAGAHVRLAREQGGDICVWYECESSAPLKPRHFRIVGTGHPLPEEGRYLGTASCEGGRFMWHVYEVVEALR